MEGRLSLATQKGGSGAEQTYVGKELRFKTHSLTFPFSKL